MQSLLAFRYLSLNFERIFLSNLNKSHTIFYLPSQHIMREEINTQNLKSPHSLNNQYQYFSKPDKTRRIALLSFKRIIFNIPSTRV